MGYLPCYLVLSALWALATIRGCAVVEWWYSQPLDYEVRGSNPGQGRNLKTRFLLHSHPSGGERRVTRAGWGQRYIKPENLSWQAFSNFSFLSSCLLVMPGWSCLHLSLLTDPSISKPYLWVPVQVCKCRCFYLLSMARVIICWLIDGRITKNWIVILTDGYANEKLMSWSMLSCWLTAKWHIR